MTILTSAAQPNSADFRANTEAMQAVVDNLKQTVDTIKQGGGDAAR